jgi:4-hydroxybutyrate CoA-transferase
MRMVSAAEAVAHVRSRDHVYIQCAAAAPSILLQALVDRAPELEAVQVVHLHIEGPAPHLAPEMEGHFHHRALFIGPNARGAISEGRAEYVPIFLSDIPRLLRDRYMPVDTVLAHVSPPDAHGYCSLGTSVEAMRAAIDSSRVVVAQINPQMPRTLGEAFVHVSEIDFGVEVDVALPEHREEPIDEVERQIGRYVADLVQDGATLQMGIGAIPSAVAAALDGKRDLGIHTEMMTDVVVDLVERGIVTGTRKARGTGKIVATFMNGTRRLYDFVDDNPMVEMRPSDYTNDPAIIREFRRMTAINSAIVVDLSGQVCADSLGHRLYSGVGGQMDFMQGASRAPEGQAIIAMPSTAIGGTVSRIAPVLPEGSGVVTTRAHVRTVVTEWGVAQLFGKGIAERARELINIAHPDFRDELRAAARRTHWL